MRKIAALVYKAKFEWRRVLGDLIRLKKPKVHLVDDAINIWTALFNMPRSPICLIASEGILNGSAWRAWGKEWKEWFRGSYSHIELLISDEAGRFQVKWTRRQVGNSDYKTTRFEYVGQCFTSTMRGDAEGTVLRPAAEVLTHPERWDVGIICTITEAEYEEGMAWCRDEVRDNLGYDKLCIADFFNPVRWWWQLHDRLKNICSEAFQSGLTAFKGIFLSRYVCSPRRLVNLLKKRGVVFTPVKGV